MKCFILLACLCALALAQDACETNSYAPKATTKIAAITPSTFFGLTSNASVESALEALFAVSQTLSSPFFQNIYVGTTDADFYMIKNCLTQQGANQFCTETGSTSPQFIAYVRNTAVFGDSTRHVFPIDSNGNVDTVNTGYGSEGTTYDPTIRPWFHTSSSSWSDAIIYASGGSGKTYSQGFNGNLVAAADKPYTEYCGACLSNSQAVSVAQAIAITDFAGANAITDTTGYSSVASKLLAAANAVGSQYNVNAYVAFPNKDSYMVKFCNQLGSTGSADVCKGHQYLLYVVNSHVSGGDSVRRAYALSADGTVGDVVSTGDVYDATSRSWYTVGNGWSDSYTFASSSVVGRTFVASLNTGFGVIGVDYSQDEPCSRADQKSNDSGAVQVVASVSVLAAVLFAL